LNLGRAYLSIEDTKSAVVALNKVIELVSKNISAYFNRGLIKESIEDYESAISDYNKVIQLNPDDAVAHYNRATCKAAFDDYGAGVSDMDEAIRIDPKNASYYKQRVNFYYRMKEKDKACFDWRKAVEFGDAKARFQIDNYCK